MYGDICSSNGEISANIFCQNLQYPKIRILQKDF